MRTHVRLGSICANGVGGPECGAIELIYSILLSNYQQNNYNYIWINQIGESLNELVLPKGKEVSINIRYDAPEGFANREKNEKNRIRLDIIHTSLCRIADEAKKLDKHILEEIRNTVMEKKFIFEFDCKVFPIKKKLNIASKIVVHPLVDRFDYFFVVKKNELEICNLKIFSAGTNIYYLPYFFGKARFKSDSEIVLTGSKNEVETHINFETCSFNIINLTSYPKPPFYTLLQGNLSEEEEAKVTADWNHSLPPLISSLIRPDKEN